MNLYITFILLFSALFSQFSYSAESGSSSIPISSVSENTVVTQAPLTVFLVRHAEKVDFSEDPELSELGKKRALELVNVLQDTDIEYVHSSDYARTRETATPTALQFDVQVSIYDPRDLAALASRVKAKGGTHLIVGHSNTTPEMAALLGGDVKSPIDDAKEFDRLYIVTVAGDSSISSILMRYGKPYNKK